MKHFRTAFLTALAISSMLSAGCTRPSSASPQASASLTASASPSAAPSTGADPSGAPSASGTPSAEASVSPLLVTPNFTIPREAFPLKLGARYVMRYSDWVGERKTREWIEETKLDKTDGDLLAFTVTSDPGKGAMKRASRIFIVSRPDALWYKVTEPPLTADRKQHSTKGASKMFKFPMRPGDNWEIIMPQGSKAFRTVIDSETVTVPAGTFRAVRIRETRDGATGESWFVPEIGMVKSDLTDVTGRHVKELVKFEAAPDLLESSPQK